MGLDPFLALDHRVRIHVPAEDQRVGKVVPPHPQAGAGLIFSDLAVVDRVRQIPGALAEQLLAGELVRGLRHYVVRLNAGRPKLQERNSLVCPLVFQLIDIIRLFLKTVRPTPRSVLCCRGALE